MCIMIEKIHKNSPFQNFDNFLLNFGGGERLKKNVC